MDCRHRHAVQADRGSENGLAATVLIDRQLPPEKSEMSMRRRSDALHDA